VVVVLVAAVLVSGTEDEFKSWAKKHNKNYPTKLEYEKRLAIFVDNLARYEKLNALGSSVLHGPTRFSDLTPSEFKLHLKKAPLPLVSTVVTSRLEGAQSFPANFSWVGKGVLTPVYDQGQCGASSVFSVVENIESVAAVKSPPLIPLSFQQVIDCSDEGCDGVYPAEVYKYVEQCGGLESEGNYNNHYPYNSSHECVFNKSKISVSISGYQLVTSNKNETQMQEYVYTKGPPVVCVDAASWESYQGGVISSSACGDQIDTCFQLVGWLVFQGTPAWIVRTSWSESFGYDGYVYVAMNQDACGIAQLCSTADISKVIH